MPFYSMISIMFDFGFAKMFSAVIFETYFCHKNIMIAPNGRCMYCYLIVLSNLTARLQIRNFRASKVLVISALYLQP